MAFCRLYLIIVLQFLEYSVDGNVSTTPVIVKSETKPLTGALLTNVTSLTTSRTTDRSSQPIITTEFKRGQYSISLLLSFVFYFYAAMFSKYAAMLCCGAEECSVFPPLPSCPSLPLSFSVLLRLLSSFPYHPSNAAAIWSPAVKRNAFWGLGTIVDGGIYLFNSMELYK